MLELDVARLPRVSEVVVGSTAWTADFLNEIDAGRGLGYSIRPAVDPVDAQSSPVVTLPWSNVDQLSVVFNQNVLVGAGDLSVAGMIVPDYPDLLGAGTYTYDPSTFTATWTLAPGSVFGMDRLILALSDSVKKFAVDPSGPDADLAGVKVFRIDILPGDATRDGAVTLVDLGVVARHFDQAAMRGDFTGDLLVSLADLGVLAGNFNKALPDGEPTLLSTARATRLDPNTIPRRSLVTAEYELRTKATRKPTRPAYRPPLGMWEAADRVVD